MLSLLVRESNTAGATPRMPIDGLHFLRKKAGTTSFDWSKSVVILYKKVESTPKYHAELAGEGIEYSWGYAKNACCWAPLAQKKGRNNFI